MCINDAKFECFTTNCKNQSKCIIFYDKLHELNENMSKYFHNHTLDEFIDELWIYNMSNSFDEAIELSRRLNKRRNEYIKDKTMEKKELNIIAPDGYEIDKENSTFEKIVFKKINELPKTWKDLKYISGAFINILANVDIINFMQTTNSAKNIFPTKELAEAALALAQLLQLRDRYNGDDKGFIFNVENHIIHYHRNAVIIGISIYTNFILSFRTAKLRDEFLHNFKDLIEIAKPLL